MPPFIVLHVCTGNICRSPMSERFLAHYVKEFGLDADYVLSMSAGTSGFHHGEDMQSNSRAELTERGVEADGFHSQPLESALLNSSDLMVSATSGHLEFISQLAPDVEDKSFLVRQLGLIADDMDTSDLPEVDGSVASVLARSQAFVAEAHKRRRDYEPLQLDDPWSLGRAVYTRIADQLDTAIEPIAAVVTGKR